MKGTSKLRERYLAWLIAICMAMAIPAAYAVVKNISIVDSQGTALANTKVTIVFPDGTEVEDETDDDGMLIFDFPGDGDYMVNYPDGQLAVNVTGGLSTWQWVAGGAVAAGIITAVVVASDDGNNNNSSGSGGSGGSGGTGGTGGGTCTAGMLNVSTTINSNPGNHPNEFDGIYDVACSGSDATVTPFSVGLFNVTWSCTVDSSGTCTAAPTDCSYASFSTTCSLNSAFDSSGGWSGTMSAGDDGALPTGQSIVVDFTGN